MELRVTQYALKMFYTHFTMAPGKVSFYYELIKLEQRKNTM